MVWKFRPREAGLARSTSGVRRTGWGVSSIPHCSLQSSLPRQPLHFKPTHFCCQGPLCFPSLLPTLPTLWPLPTPPWSGPILVQRRLTPLSDLLLTALSLCFRAAVDRVVHLLWSTIQILSCEWLHMPQGNCYIHVVRPCVWAVWPGVGEVSRLLIGDSNILVRFEDKRCF